MKINISTVNRFHLLDLARELQNQGHDVRFYSYVPTKRVVKFGLEKSNTRSFYCFMIPFLGLNKLLGTKQWTLFLLHEVMDVLVSRLMRRCDLYIGLGVVYKRSFEKAKNKFNAKTIVEWGSKHIDVQQEILSHLPKYSVQDSRFIEKVKFQYEFADFIAIPSQHVKESFIQQGINPSKLLLNPYAVNLSMFYPTELVNTDVYDLIMVGGWSYRKGCDLLIEVCQMTDLRLLHVGSIVDIDFPEHKNMTHIDSVDESELVNFYAKAKVFVLPSREEGLALVQPQALMCGLPIVCSAHTGGRDLKDFLQDKKWIIEMEEYSVNCLLSSIHLAIKLANTQKGKRTYCEDIKEKFSWKAYGERYKNNIIKIL